MRLSSLAVKPPTTELHRRIDRELAVDHGRSDAAIAAKLGCGATSVRNRRRPDQKRGGRAAKPAPPAAPAAVSAPSPADPSPQKWSLPRIETLALTVTADEYARPNIIFADGRAASFSCELLARKLSEVAAAHRDLETRGQALAGGGLASAVDTVDRIARSFQEERFRRTAGFEMSVNAAAGSHVAQLSEAVRVCAERATADGTEAGLRLFCDTLEAWGTTGCDPERVAAGGDPNWDRRRRAVEKGAAALADKFMSHPEYVSASEPPDMWREGEEIHVCGRFWADSGFFAVPDRWNPEWDMGEVLDPEQERKLLDMASGFARDHLDEGETVVVNAYGGEKGLLGVIYRITGE